MPSSQHAHFTMSFGVVHLSALSNHFCEYQARSFRAPRPLSGPTYQPKIAGVLIS
jgi:hypothetical protein